MFVEVPALRQRCIEGIEVDVDRCKALLDQSLVLATPLARLIGYSRASYFAKRALTEKRTLRQVIEDEGALTLPESSACESRALIFNALSIREQDGEFADFVQQSGLLTSETVTTMSKGRRFLNRQENRAWVYGLAGHALC